MTKRKVAFLSVSMSLMLTLLAAGLFGQAAQKENLYRYLGIFAEVLQLARSNYVEMVDPQQLVEGAFSGVTDAIDEFSYYVPPTQMRQYGTYRAEEDPSAGTGLVVTKRFGYAQVISVIDGSPGFEAKVKAGDFIEAIDGTPTQKTPIWEIARAMQGSEGKIKLGLLRGGMSKREQITLTRRTFAPSPVTVEEKSGVAYLRIPRFSAGTSAQLAQALNQIEKSGEKQLIIDVRGNATGSVEEAVKSVDELLTRGTITALSGRRVDAKRWNADANRSFTGDLLVLTDATTAGPGEVFAAAITGNKRGRLVGVTTYGRALTQRFVPLPSGGGLFLTIGHYTTPDLKPIAEGGVRPDVTVDLGTLAAEKEDDAAKKDIILEKALSLFGQKAPARAAA